MQNISLRQKPQLRSALERRECTEHMFRLGRQFLASSLGPPL